MMGAVLINENDEVMFFNPAAEKLWGYNVKKSLAITLIC